MGLLIIIGIILGILIILIILMAVYYFWMEKKLDLNEEIIKKDHLMRLKAMRRK